MRVQTSRALPDFLFRSKLNAILLSSISKVNLLLPASVFFDVIKKLLHSSNSTVRRKAMELLNSKLSNSAGSYPTDQVFGVVYQVYCVI